MESGSSMDLKVDRLSSLPDNLIYKILSYVDIIYSMRLSVVSSRWRFISTSMPTLNFDSSEVDSISSRYPEFLKAFLSARNDNIDLSSVSMCLSLYYRKLSVERILEYAFSHNVQQLSISILFGEIPPCQLSSKSLKHLTMCGIIIDCRSYSHSWDLPALTTLHLQKVKLHSFSSILAMCQNLKNLTLDRCQVCEHAESGVFTIINSRLVSLMLKKVTWYVGFVLVETPQLKNFIFVDALPGEEWIYGRKNNNALCELTISASGLTYLRIKGSYFPKLSFDGFCSLEKVDLCISSPQKTDVHKIHDLFQCLHSVKSLALSLEIVELLSTCEEVISHKPSPFTSLKSLKIYPSKGLKTLTSQNLRINSLESILDMFLRDLDQEPETMKEKSCAEFTTYLLGGSSNATFTTVSHEEARAIKITKVAYRTMAVLLEILEDIEAYTDTKRDNGEWKTTLADEDYNMKIRPPGNTKEIFCLLKNIKLLLPKVIASKRVEMQACFSRLCAKTKSVVHKMAVEMKNQCDMKQHIFSGYVDEIALSP